MEKQNRLINEKSPYLLQHSRNPVNWFPWSEEAFNLAAREDKPIFLSIGYSTCHWCHVMERESFEDEQVAKLINDVFINIKVDREERPDVDGIYMKVCQIMTGHGGWPLTIIMTPDKKPFYAATYIPRDSKMGRIGMTELIPKIDKVWKEQKEKIFTNVEQILKYLEEEETLSTEIDPTIIEKIVAEFRERFDEEYGGFGSRPKFPTPHNLLFLLAASEYSNDNTASEMVEKTLMMMRIGGIYDHIGFGFHRYSTDSKWLLPHFEKMLYDQSLMLIAYSQAFHKTKNELFKNTAIEIVEYLKREMLSPEGGFFSAEDADSEGEEGKFYVWEFEELKNILNNSEIKFFERNFNVSEIGNFNDEATGLPSGKNIPHKKYLLTNLEEEKFERIRKKLFIEREKRVHPHKDDKILTDWNGLTIAALAIAGRLLNINELIILSENAVKFIYKNMFIHDRLMHRFRDGETAFSANLDDYAYLCWGLLELFKTTHKPIYLEKVISLDKILTNEFWDEKNSGYFFSGKNSEKLIIRNKDFYDGAIPSGNSVHFSNLLFLYKVTSNTEFLKRAEKMVSNYGGKLKAAPIAYAHFLSGLISYFSKSVEIIIVEGEQGNSIEEITNYLESEKNFNSTLIVLTRENREEMISLAEYLKKYSSIGGETTIYLCENYECKLPVTSLSELKKLLREIY
ncbi:MAG: thioredoxin domain-containing protein [Melioribacteraceae bacterium]|nr:thioredoxin domain-containing protein [Melioribacteraceae bacterium]